jgi:hypothetical protein
MVYRENQVCPVRIGLDKNRARSRFLGLGIAVPEVTVRKKSSRILVPTHVDWRAVRVFLALATLTARMQEAAHGQPLPHLPPPAVLAAVIFAQSLTLGVLVTSVFTFGEEFGWTGYLLVLLFPLGRWRAALIWGSGTHQSLLAATTIQVTP